MELLKFCLIIHTLVSLSQQSINYRLPKNAIPYHYNLRIEPHIVPGNFVFNGEADIFIDILRPTTNLTLHSSNLRINEKSTLLIGRNEIFVPELHIFEEEPQFLILNFLHDLQPGIYELFLEYTGELNSQPRGFFQTSYLDDKNETTFLVSTQFEATFAREAFPCWDEPALKATFDIKIQHFPNYTALSNMPVLKKINGTKNNGKIWTEFEHTPRMSTYLVAFAVSDFVNITNPQGNLTFWVRKNAVDSVGLGYNTMLEAFRVLEEYTNIPYNLPKMDCIVVPGHHVDTMENWGLITFQELDILKNPNSSLSDEMRVIEAAVHEVSHQWIGNLISPDWWADLWLTEGLTTYFHYFLTAKVIREPKFEEFFVVENNQILFRIEEYTTDFIPLHLDRDDPNGINYHVRYVHQRAAAIMHMLSGLLSENVFQIGIRQLLEAYRFRTVTTDQFWETMQAAMSEAKLSCSKFELKKVMDPFISEVGYPVVNVTRDYKTGTIKLTQECVSCQHRQNSGKGKKFWIPVNFATKSSPNFSSTFATHWIDPDKEELIIEGVDPEDWVIFNIQSSAYYRVSYDNQNWEKIAEYLDSGEFSKIHVLNRAALLDDARWSTLNRRMDKLVLLKLTHYLTREEEYLPWVPGFEILENLVHDLSFFEVMEKNDSSHLIGDLLEAYISNLVSKPGQDLFSKLKFEKAVVWSQIYLEE